MKERERKKTKYYLFFICYAFHTIHHSPVLLALNSPSTNSKTLALCCEKIIHLFLKVNFSNFAHLAAQVGYFGARMEIRKCFESSVHRLPHVYRNCSRMDWLGSYLGICTLFFINF